MKVFILKSEDETIAIITLTDKDTFYRNVRLAISEHFICNVMDVVINISTEDYNKELYSQDLDIDIIEDGETYCRVFSLEEVCIY
jgi:hypothetical protein